MPLTCQRTLSEVVPIPRLEADSGLTMVHRNLRSLLLAHRFPFKRGYLRLVPGASVAKGYGATLGTEKKLDSYTVYLVQHKTAPQGERPKTSLPGPEQFSVERGDTHALEPAQATVSVFRVGHS